MRFIVGLLFIVSLSIASCGKEDQREIDQQLIQEYISENNLDASSTASGLHYVINNPGNNEHPNFSSTVKVIYTGTLLNGSQFDASDSAGITLPLNQFIQGWIEGIPLFGKGGEGILIIPSHLGYGPSPRGSIPANSVLVFEIKLVNFN
jgi:FKBP-type peptidyl-prolyl cis-trans isomerase FkpA